MVAGPIRRATLSLACGGPASLKAAGSGSAAGMSSGETPGSGPREACGCTSIRDTSVRDTISPLGMSDSTAASSRRPTRPTWPFGLPPAAS
eukprot:scaffold848_cov88-Phaeocystis_antarctica.AAC.2